MLFNMVKFNVNFTLPIRHETFNGRDHIVAPVIALVEGVHIGSGGALFYPASEMEKYVEAWNGRPLPVMHPQDGSNYVSANTPRRIEEQSVGQLFNMRYEDEHKRLVGEIWIDVEKAKSISPVVLETIQAGRKLEISTALYSDGDGKAGEWNGEKFDQTVYNYRPDHLALLPGGTGACSWEDGCGIRANDDGTYVYYQPDGLEAKVTWVTTNGQPDENKLKVAVKAILQKMGFVKTNEVSHEQLRSKLQAHLDALDNEGWIHYVRDVYDNYFVYAARTNNPSEGTNTEKLYKQDYTANDDGEVTISGDPAEVTEKIEYVPVTSNKENSDMNREEVIKALVECKHNTLTSDNEEWLKTLDDEQLTAMQYCKGDDPPVANDADPPKDDKTVTEPTTMEEYINNAPPEMRDTLRRSVDRDKEIKANLVKGLLDNKRCKFTEDELSAKSIGELEHLAELGQVENDYSLSGGSSPETNDDNDSPPEMIPVFPINKEKQTA
jgi:hypothetical protein